MDNFIGELRVFAYSKIPQGWIACEGQTLQIQQNAALYSLVGIAYGGDGQTTFKLPDLRGRAMVCYGLNNTNPNPSPASYNIGNNGGTETVVLNQNTVPAHTHTVSLKNTTGNTFVAAGSTLCAIPQVPGLANENIVTFDPTSSPPGTVNLNAATIVTAGASAGHENRMPSLALQICIATAGIYPQRN